jgi:hypothetical protein
MCADIGSWQYVFETISYVSVVSNLAIVCFTNKSPMFGFQLTFVDRMIFFIVAEHMVLFLKYALATYIPDEPFDTKLQLQRQSTYLTISTIRALQCASCGMLHLVLCVSVVIFPVWLERCDLTSFVQCRIPCEQAY